MKNKVLIFLVILVLLAINPMSVFAQSPTPTDIGSVEVVGNKASVNFAQLGFRDDTLTSPFDVTRVLFSIPTNWRLTTGGELEINYDLFFSGSEITKLVDGVNPYGGALSVIFNQKVIGTIPLDKVGSNTARFELPEEALVSAREDGRHQLNIALNAQFSCTYDLRATVVIKATSKFVLPFEISAPVLDLARLPAPFYLENALIPDRTVIVTPDDASPGELQAALNILAGLGSLIGTSSDFDMVNIGALSNDDLNGSNLIFVGKPNHLSLLSEVNFPLAVTGGKFTNLPAASADDGVLQLALSPWNENKAVMLVGGNSDEAVAKAAFAVSSGGVFVFDNPQLSFVSSVKLLAENLPVVTDFSFQNLGYKTETISGVGLLSTDYLFSVAKEQVATRDGYIDLVYYHSGLLDYGQSSLTVSLNDQVINGTPFSVETEKLTTLRINIPVGLLRFGENRLTIGARMLTTDSCDSSGFSTPWLTISDQSRFHIPATNTDGPVTQLIIDLKSFPGLFLTHSDLGDLAFVLPKGNTDSLRIAGKLAYNFGVTATPVLPNLAAAYADSVPEAVRTGKSLIVIGLANTVPLLNEINDRLPAPFNFNDNTASEENMQISYRIPEGVSVGYLELLASPFNLDNMILVVSGNTQQGLEIAGNTLLQPALTSQMAGLFAVSNGTKVATSATATNFSIIGNVLPGAEPVINQPVLPAPVAPGKLSAPFWLFPFLVISAVLVVLVLGYVIATAMLRRRTPKIDNTSE